MTNSQYDTFISLIGRIEPAEPELTVKLATVKALINFAHGLPDHQRYELLTLLLRKRVLEPQQFREIDDAASLGSTLDAPSGNLGLSLT